LTLANYAVLAICKEDRSAQADGYARSMRIHSAAEPYVATKDVIFNHLTNGTFFSHPRKRKRENCIGTNVAIDLGFDRHRDCHVADE
jgi:hypothetical protein